MLLNWFLTWKCFLTFSAVLPWFSFLVFQLIYYDLVKVPPGGTLPVWSACILDMTNCCAYIFDFVGSFSVELVASLWWRLGTLVWVSAQFVVIMALGHDLQ